MKQPAGYIMSRYTTLARSFVRFHDAGILTDTRLFRLCFEPIHIKPPVGHRIQTVRHWPTSSPNPRSFGVLLLPMLNLKAMSPPAFEDTGCSAD